MTYQLMDKHSLNQMYSQREHAIWGLFCGIWDLCVRDCYLVIFSSWSSMAMTYQHCCVLWRCPLHFKTQMDKNKQSSCVSIPRVLSYTQSFSRYRHLCLSTCFLSLHPYISAWIWFTILNSLYISQHQTVSIRILSISATAQTVSHFSPLGQGRP